MARNKIPKAYEKELFLIARPEAVPDELAEECNLSFDCYKTADGTLLLWSGGDKLPWIGDLIAVPMNNIGVSLVVGYFSSPSRLGVSAFLGVMALPLNPPAYYKRQTSGYSRDPRSPEWMKQGVGCFFGSEIRNATAAEDPVVQTKPIMSPDKFAEFISKINQAPAPKPRLKKLMKDKGVLD